MNYTFLITMLAFLAIASPPLLYAAHREGERRRARIGQAKNTLDEQIRKLTEQSVEFHADNERLRNELAMARAAYESERAKEHDEQGPRWRKEPPTRAEVGQVSPWWWVRSPRYRMQVVHLLQTFDSDDVIVLDAVEGDGPQRLGDLSPDGEWAKCLPPTCDERDF